MNTNKRRYKCAEACNTCKRRKERCDGNQPCVRCIQRGVSVACQYQPRQRLASHEDENTRSRNSSAPWGADDSEAHAERRQIPESDHSLTLVTTNTSMAAVSEPARLLQTKGNYMFIGDSANLSLLRSIRNLVSASVGPCPFVDDPFRDQMVESAPEGAATWMHPTDSQNFTKPTMDEAVYLIQRYTIATKCVLDLIDEEELLCNLPGWLSCRSKQDPVLSAIYYLTFAIGAQTCPEDKEASANLYFDQGRYISASQITEDPSIATVQVHALITMYLLGASRRNAAFMCLGTAVRAAYALGLHRSDIATLFPATEVQTRERLWKTIRVLDLFVSASLGRPPGTAETRNTELDDGYSSVTDLCAIYERILIDVYAKRMVTTETVQKISEHHRRWTKRFHRGQSADRINNKESIDSLLPNVGLLHVKEAFYWTILLLTRPFLVDYVSQHVRSPQGTGGGQDDPGLQSSDHVLVHACINSATCTVELLKVLLVSKGNPKSLPFVVNSLFVAGLVLGLGYFGDFYKTYALESSLQTTLELLALFPRDAIAKRYSAILGMLLDACNTYVRRLMKKNMARKTQLVNGMFGQIDNVQTTESRSTGNARPIATDAGGLTQEESNGYRTSDTAFEGSNDAGPAADNFYHAGSDVSTLFSTASSAMPGFENDFLVPPAISSRTLWFGSYEDNAPFFSTVNARYVSSTEEMQ